MEAIWTAVAIGIAAALLLACGRRQRRNGQPTQWPPGPPKLPIIGNMHQILKGGDPLHVYLSKLARVYGPLITVWLGTRRPTIIVSDHDLAWEVLVSKSPDYAAREFPTLTKLVTADFRTIVSSNAGPHWHTLRRGLQNGAIGPLSLSVQAPLQESDMAQMINDMIKEANLNGGVVKPFHHIRRATIRLLARLCFGPDFSNVGKLQVAFAVSNLVNAFHWSNAVEGEKPDLAEDLTFVLAMKTPLEARIVPRGI